MWGSGKGKLRDGAGMAVRLKSEAGPGIRSLGIFGKTSIWALPAGFLANSGIFEHFAQKRYFWTKTCFGRIGPEIRTGFPVLPPTARARPSGKPLRNRFRAPAPSRRLILAKTPKMGEIGQNWPKLAKTGQKWAKLAENGQNWPKLAKLVKIGQN